MQIQRQSQTSRWGHWLIIVALSCFSGRGFGQEFAMPTLEWMIENMKVDQTPGNAENAVSWLSYYVKQGPARERLAEIEPYLTDPDRQRRAGVASVFIIHAQQHEKIPVPDTEAFWAAAMETLGKNGFPTKWQMETFRSLPWIGWKSPIAEPHYLKMLADASDPLGQFQAAYILANQNHESVQPEISRVLVENLKIDKIPGNATKSETQLYWLGRDNFVQLIEGFTPADSQQAAMMERAAASLEVDWRAPGDMVVPFIASQMVSDDIPGNGEAAMDQLAAHLALRPSEERFGAVERLLTHPDRQVRAGTAIAMLRAYRKEPGTRLPEEAAFWDALVEGLGDDHLEMSNAWQTLVFLLTTDLGDQFPETQLRRALDHPGDGQLRYSASVILARHHRGSVQEAISDGLLEHLKSDGATGSGMAAYYGLVFLGRENFENILGRFEPVEFQQAAFMQILAGYFKLDWAAPERFLEEWPEAYRGKFSGSEIWGAIFIHPSTPVDNYPQYREKARGRTRTEWFLDHNSEFIPVDRTDNLGYSNWVHLADFPLATRGYFGPWEIGPAEEADAN